MTNQVNVIIMVDSIKALIDQSLEGNCFMVDDSPFNSTGKGSLNLTTQCMPYQTIHWTVKAIDVQTPVSIKEISFQSDSLSFPIAEDQNLDALVWNGIAPFVGVNPVTYNYKIVLQIGKGSKSELEISTPALTIDPLIRFINLLTI